MIWLGVLSAGGVVLYLVVMSVYWARKKKRQQRP